MKLRLEKGIIKLRLAPAEIDKLYVEKSLEEKLYFSKSNQFKYSINIDGRLVTCTTNFQQNSLQVNIPLQQAEKWINSNQIGIKETIVTDNGSTIVLTLEEDLPPRKHKKK